MRARRSATTAAPADPCCVIIFGASGDLTHRLLVPALYNLAAEGLLPDAFSIVGVARGERSDEAFRTDLANGLRNFAIGTIEENSRIDYSTASATSAGMLTMRQPTRGSRKYSRGSSAHATRAETASSTSRHHHQHSRRSAVISPKPSSPARRMEHGAG